MDLFLLVERAARSLDERGKTPFSAQDVYNFIQQNSKINVTIDQVIDALETLSISNEKPAPMRKCIYKDKGGYSYLHACSFGVR